MVSVIKAASDTRLHRHKSTSLLLPSDYMSSRNCNHISKYRSRKRIYNHSFQNSMESINDNYQRFSNNTHFPIANIQRDSTIISKTSSSKLPTVPKQAGTFIHRLLNKFFSITNIKQKKTELSRLKRTQREQMNTSALNTRLISDDSHTFLNLTSKRRKRRQRSKIITNNKNCVACRKYRNCCSILQTNKKQCLPTDCVDYTSQSPIIFNSNATTTLKNHLVLTAEPFIPSTKLEFEKKQTLNESQCRTIASAVELIFDTLISNYQQI